MLWQIVRAMRYLRVRAAKGGGVKGQVQAGAVQQQMQRARRSGAQVRSAQAKKREVQSEEKRRAVQRALVPLANLRRGFDLIFRPRRSIYPFLPLSNHG